MNHIYDQPEYVLQAIFDIEISIGLEFLWSIKYEFRYMWE